MPDAHFNMKFNLGFVVGILEKQLDSLNLKDVDNIKDVPETTKQNLKMFITQTRDAEKLTVWLRDQRLHIDLIQR
jgi:hypothetical protein